MTATSRSAVWTGGREFRVESAPVPEPGPGQLRVRVHACGVCMTEVHSLDGHFSIRTPPCVLGHEWGGVVEALGPGVTGLAVGTPIAGAGMGGFAEHVVLAADRVFPLPAGLPLEAACFVEPLACCLAAVENAGIAPGASVLITGCGPMGLMLLQLARQAGASMLLVSEPSAPRRELARRLGADRVLDPRAESLAEAVAASTDGRGVAVALESAGQPAALGDCVEALAEGGTAVVVGVAPSTARLDLPLYRFHRRNLTLRGSYGAPVGGGFAAAAARLPRLELGQLVSHRFGLADVAAAFDAARSGRGLKVLVGAGAAG
jgi:threonine dehydrogenase-like Zn-dependent dehydrogenase